VVKLCSLYFSMTCIAADDVSHRERGFKVSCRPSKPRPFVHSDSWRSCVSQHRSEIRLKCPATHRAAELNIMSGTLGPGVLDISHLTRDLGVFNHSYRRRCGEPLYRGYPVEQLSEGSAHPMAMLSAGVALNIFLRFPASPTRSI
jgi:hypothetical protein